MKMACKNKYYAMCPTDKNINAVSLPRDEAVDHDLVCLPDPVGPGEGLDVVVRVPVGVVDDDGVRSGQVDTQTSSPGIYI